MPQFQNYKHGIKTFVPSGSLTGSAAIPINDNFLVIADLLDDTVTAAGTQTLTNKTISGASNTFINVPQTAVLNLVSDLAARAMASDLAAHTSNTSNPHSVTKAQVGLGNVLNAAQLIAANNLSDLASAATARTNLGLGTAAITDSTAYDSAGAAAAVSGTLSTHVADQAAHGATSANTASKIVARDSSGNFSAGTITGALSGNATTATTAGTISGSITESQVTNLVSDLALKAPLANPTFTGTSRSSGGFVVGTEVGGYVSAGNHRMQIVATTGQSPLMLLGGDNAVEYWKDTTPTEAWAFGLAVPGSSVGDDFIFSEFSASGGFVWHERVRFSTAGTVTATSFVGSGASLTSINGSNVTTGTVAAARVADLSATYVPKTGDSTVTGSITTGGSNAGIGINSRSGGGVNVLYAPDATSFHWYNNHGASSTLYLEGASLSTGSGTGTGGGSIRLDGGILRLNSTLTLTNGLVHYDDGIDSFDVMDFGGGITLFQGVTLNSSLDVNGSSINNVDALNMTYGGFYSSAGVTRLTGYLLADYDNPIVLSSTTGSTNWRLVVDDSGNLSTEAY